MDIDRSDYTWRRPIPISIDYTTPFVEVDIAGGSAPLTGTSSHGGGSPSPIPNATYNLLDVPISTSKAVRIGCWSPSPIDSDAFKGKIPDFLPTSKGLPAVIKASGASSSGRFLPVRTGPNTSTLGKPSGDAVIYSCSADPAVKYDPSQECHHIPGSMYVTNRADRTWIVRALKEALKLHEAAFKSQYSYSTTMMEERHLFALSPAPGVHKSWKEKSSGIMWFGVYGHDDICAVTLSGHLDSKRVHGGLASSDPKYVLSSFRRCVLSELEDLADPSSKRREELHGDFDTPFCVVSATPSTGHETYAAEAMFCARGSKVLRQVQNSGDAIKAAIFGFQRLMGRKCEAKEIEVTVLFGRNFGSGYTRDLDISEIGDYLAAAESIMPGHKYVSEGLYREEN